MEHARPQRLTASSDGTSHKTHITLWQNIRLLSSTTVDVMWGKRQCCLPHAVRCTSPLLRNCCCVRLSRTERKILKLLRQGSAVLLMGRSGTGEPGTFLVEPSTTLV